MKWPLRWPFNLFCSHPSTEGEWRERGDGSWGETFLECLRCGRVLVDELGIDEAPK